MRTIQTLSRPCGSYEITIPTRPRRDLFDDCFAVIRRHSLPIRQVSLVRSNNRGDRQDLTIETGECAEAVAEAVAGDLASGEPPRIRKMACASAAQASLPAV